MSAPGPAVDSDGTEVESQEAAIEEACATRGWTLAKIVRDVEPADGKSSGRPGLEYAIDRLAVGEASCLVVSALDRLTRSVAELGALLEWFSRGQATLLVVDLGLDTSTPSGRLVARTLTSVSRWERDKLSARTRQGLAAARAKGSTSRPAVRDLPGLKRRIVAMREAGMTLQAIADTLNAEGVPTLRGGMHWRPSSVQSAAGYKRPRRKGKVVDLPPPKRPDAPADR